MFAHTDDTPQGPSQRTFGPGNRGTSGLAAVVLLLTSILIAIWFRFLLTSTPLPSVDLPSHIALSELFIEQWKAGRIQFFDRSSYTGWPAMTFDGFLPYLLTGLLSLVCNSISDAPVRLAAHLILLLGVSTVPYSLYYASRPLVRGGDRASDLALACTVSMFGFWFLNHDQQYFGIGAAAPINIGLYPQLFGWHLMLLLTGALFRIVGGATALCPLAALLLSLLALSHLQTFVFAVFLLLFALCYFSERRRAVAAIMTVGILTAGIYLAPCVALLGEFTAYDVHRPKGDLLQLLLRYPLYNLLLVLLSAAKGQAISIDPIHILIPFLLFATLVTPSLRSRPGVSGLALFIVLATLLLSSDFIASSLPFGFHYYRFLGYLFILATVLLCAVLTSLIGFVSGRPQRAIALLCLGVMGGAVASLPHPERARLYSKVDAEYLSHEKAVLEQLRLSGRGGRVYVEHLNDYKRFAPLSVHFIASRAYIDAGVESLANTFLQRSLAYRMFVESARLLGAKTYNVPLLFSKHTTLDDQTKLAQLRSFGVTHVVAGTDRFKTRLEKLEVPRLGVFGPYSIFGLQPAPFTALESVRKIPIGYIDQRGTLPFRFLESYFQGNQELYSRYELIELRRLQPVPKELSLLLVNSIETPPLQDLPYIQLRYAPRRSIDHAKPAIPKNIELDAYRDVERYLSNVVALTKSLSSVVGQTLEPRAASGGSVTWEDRDQALSLAELEPGRLYRLNYSYFPYWKSDDAELFRGSGERMFVVPKQPKVKLTYSWWNHPSSLVGICMSGLGVLAIALMWRRPLRS